MRKLYILCVIASAAFIIGLAWADQITLTTYYPAPYGVYKVMRLAPQAAAPATASDGDLYVNSTDNHIYCRLNGVWVQLDP